MKIDDAAVELAGLLAEAGVGEMVLVRGVGKAGELAEAVVRARETDLPGLVGELGRAENGGEVRARGGTVRIRVVPAAGAAGAGAAEPMMQAWAGGRWVEWAGGGRAAVAGQLGLS